MQFRLTTGQRAATVVVAVCAAVVLVLSVITPPAAMASPVAGEASGGDQTAVPNLDVPSMVAEHVPADDPESVVEYWTEERMRSARPMELELSGDGVGTPTPGWASAADGLVHDTRHLTVEEVDRHPHSSIGKVFFTLNGFNFFCSASAVTSAGRWGEGSRQLVLTAGHCLNDGEGIFATQFMFVPGYHYDEAWGDDYDEQDVAPSGRWAAELLFTTPEWNEGLGLAHSRDVGFALVTGTGEFEGALLHEVVEPLGIAFTRPHPEDGLNLGVAPSIGMDYAMFGYGVANWGGEQQVRTLSKIDVLDPAFSPSPFGAPSTHTGGSSGGPWLYNYAEGSNSPPQNVVTGINAYVYNGVDRLYSPQLDDQIHGLWTFVNTRIPTTTTVTSPQPDPSVFGQPVTLTATVTSADFVVAGSVTVTDTTTGALLGTGNLDEDGEVELVVDSPSAGTNTIDVTYLGNNYFEPSSDIALHTTEQAPTITTVDSSSSPSVFGQPVNLTATVASTHRVPGGSVTFTDTATDTLLGTGTLNVQGKAEVTLDSLPVGTTTIDATYLGSNNFEPSSGTTLHTTEQAPTTTTVSTSPTASVFGQPVTVTATVASTHRVPGGSVTFTDTVTDIVLGTGTLNDDGEVAVTTTALPVGTHTIAATYAGTGDFEGSTGTATHTVVPAFVTAPEPDEEPDPDPEPELDPEPEPVSVTVLTAGPGPAPSGGGAPDPGEVNVGQAIAWSQYTNPSTEFAQAGGRTVLLGRADLFADSLASGGAQGLLDAPLLLTGRDTLNRQVADELERLQAETVILLGGTAALSTRVAAELAGLGYTVQRLAGPTRIETAVEVAWAMAPNTRSAVIVRAHPAPDADPTQGAADVLAAGALAADLGVPLLLTETERLSAATADYLRQSGATSAVIVGGDDAVGEQVLDGLVAMDITPVRHAGPTRFATATAIAAARGAATASDADSTILIDGGDVDAWADAFPAALAASRTLTPIVLADRHTLPDVTAAYFAGGGTPLVCGMSVRTTACHAARDALQGD